MDLDDRSFRFLCDVIRFVRTIRFEPGGLRVIDQRVAAAGSIAANRQEATSSSSRREFIRFNEIALRSAKEAVSRQLARILGAIAVRSKFKS
jgi:four helix bundle protein